MAWTKFKKGRNATRRGTAQRAARAPFHIGTMAMSDAVVISNKNRQQKSPGRNPGLDAKRSLEDLPPTAAAPAELVVQAGGDDVDAAVTGTDRRNRRITKGPSLVGQADIVIFGPGRPVARERPLDANTRGPS
jgi:hypothetical protein